MVNNHLIKIRYQNDSRVTEKDRLSAIGGYFCLIKVDLLPNGRTLL